MAEAGWLWIYVAAMAAGAAVIIAWSRDPRGVPHYEYAAAAFIPIWSGLAYMASAMGQGILLVDGREVYLTRYIDWVVTTPLLLATLAWTAMFTVRKHASLIITIMGADVIMILSGLMADLTVDETIRWVWYAVGCVCLGIIFFVTWGPFRRIAFTQGETVGSTYVRVATFLSVMWVGYPLVWALGPSGIGLLGSTTDVALFVILPILSKVGFSLYDLASLRRLAQAVPAHHTREAHDHHGDPAIYGRQRA
ncbi:lactococcin [Erythrobacteraceae bacterium CFH 75059]|uniref:bacteriorhodopsin n=1 Tax=Qipengyuania thermophila TaxID=2509361 RepID=UPI0010216712|nr:bacteriorhodopsin [Qipengyuania thermophila]TCD04787.1 lactococcin [Erythrobacteraceae bacterium CFH 75059]